MVKTKSVKKHYLGFIDTVVLITLALIFLIILGCVFYYYSHNNYQNQSPQKLPVICSCPNMPVKTGITGTGPAPCYCPE